MKKYKNYEKKIIYSLVRIILGMGIISISIFAIVQVFNHIINYPFLKQFVIKEEAPRINITVDNSSEGNSMFVSDENGLRFRKSDKSFARDEWIDKNGELFYFDLSSYGKEGSMKYEGQIYYFENGKLKRISRDTTEPSKNDQYFNGIDSLQYFIYLDKEDNINNNYSIKYIKYADDEEDYLGTKNDKQYCRPNFLKINMSHIYYLGIDLNNNSNRKLYRMVPNSQTRETVGSNVEGYIVLSDDVVYYYNGNIVVKAKNWTKEKVKYVDEDNIFDDMMNSSPIDDMLSTKSNIIYPGNGIPLDRNNIVLDETIQQRNYNNNNSSSNKDLFKDNAPISNDGPIVPVLETKEEEVIIGKGPTVSKELTPDIILPDVVSR